jgi:hypothetical protein
MKTHKIIVTIEVVVETDHGPDAIATTVLESILHDEGFHDSIAEEIDILQDRFEDDAPPLEGE